MNRKRKQQTKSFPFIWIWKLAELYKPEADFCAITKWEHQPGSFSFTHKTYKGNNFNTKQVKVLPKTTVSTLWGLGPTLRETRTGMAVRERGRSDF